MENVTKNWTVEQENIFKLIGERNNLIIQAFAGTGKTSTLEEAAKRLSARDYSYSAIALAFNSAISKEMADRMPPWITCKTMNAVGHAIVANRFPGKIYLNQNKVGKLTLEILSEDEEFMTVLNEIEAAIGKPETKSLNHSGIGGEFHRALASFISAIKSAGMIPEFIEIPGILMQRSYTPFREISQTDIEEAWRSDDVREALDFCAFANPKIFGPLVARLVGKIFEQDLQKTLEREIDFSDQLFIPLVFCEDSFPKFNLIFGDESQDFSPAQQRFIKNLANERTQVVFVGDAHQAIYGWRGAATNSMELLRKLFPNMKEAKLSVTWRCPKAIVERQTKHAIGYTAAPNAPEGNVETFNYIDEKLLARLRKMKNGAIICRNNSPLVRTAFMLIREKIPVGFNGKDLLAGIASFILQSAERDKEMLAMDVIPRIKENHARKSAAKIEKKQDTSFIDDQASTAIFITASVIAKSKHATVKDVLAEIAKVAENKAGKENVILVSGHRSKGLEFDTVVFLCPNLIPSSFAISNPEALTQEFNLRYVIETRAKATLILCKNVRKKADDDEKDFLERINQKFTDSDI